MEELSLTEDFFLWAACVVLNIIISFFLFLYKRKCSCIYLENGMQKLLKLLISYTYQDMDTDLEYRNAVHLWLSPGVILF